MADNKYLLNVSIGPVQEFIAEARKTRDLWVGSYMLSMVTFKALEPLIKNNCKIIYPFITDSSLYKKIIIKLQVTDESLQIASIPNHFLVVVSGNALEDIIKKSKQNLDDYWTGLAKNIKDKLNNLLVNIPYNWFSQWDSQVNDLWQLCGWLYLQVMRN